MKKSSIITILVIFILPVALYFFFKTPSESNVSIASPVNKPQVLQFSSQMCYDCKRVEKEIAPLRQEFASQVVFRKYNASTRTEAINRMISQYDINVVPTLIFLDKNGALVRKTEGYLTRDQIRIYLKELTIS